MEIIHKLIDLFAPNIENNGTKQKWAMILFSVEYYKEGISSSKKNEGFLWEDCVNWF